MSRFDLRAAMVVAALATISVLGQAISRVLSDNMPASELATAGTLGLVFFITAFSVQRVVSRASRNEQLARQRAADLEELHDAAKQREDIDDFELALEALEELCETEGILTALETSHAFVAAKAWARENPGKRILIGNSGRGDKDMPTLTKFPARIRSYDGA